MVSPLAEYADYRAYIRDFYLAKKKLRQGFSFRLFAKRSGLKSPNFLQLVIQGKRSLSSESAARVAKAMGLSAGELRYFCALVEKDLAKSSEQKIQAQKSMLSAMRNILTREIPKAQSVVLQDWYHLVIREMLLLSEFKPSGVWIAKQLHNLISPAQAENSLKLLSRAGLIEKTARGFSPKEVVIDTGDNFDFARVLSSHSQILAVWQSLLESLNGDERELGLLNIPIASAKIPELKKRMREFQDEIMGWLQDPADADQVIQLGTYLIPITRKG